MTSAPGALAPLREGPFRRIWSASVLSNFSQLFLGVGAAWEMTRLNDSPSMVALVQTAMMLPLMTVTLPAGAIADMFDKRKTAMAGLAFASASAAGLTVVAHLDMLTPWLLLAFCALTGAGVALFVPAWQASIPEQVSRQNLPAAVGLGTISFNIARSFGPAVGGLIVLAAGAKMVFGLTSLLYAPLLIAFFLWKREIVPSRLPPERIDRAIIGGARYALHSPSIRTSLARVFLFGLMSAASAALAPLVAKDLLGGDASVFGILLGSQGAGAVLGALFVSHLRHRFSTESTIRVCAIICGLAIACIGLSPTLLLTCMAYFVVGSTNILSIALLNVSVQLSAPRWVTARALALFSSSITAGFGIGALIWGLVANMEGVTAAFVVSGVAVMLTSLLGYALPLTRDQEGEDPSVSPSGDPKDSLGLNLRSGPIVVEIEYDVDPAAARDFYGVMTRLQRVRKRNGGFDWSLARDIENPAVWTERYHCPTWGDYLRMRDRYTQTDIALQAEADAYDRSPAGRRVRRRLARPFGSVRWKANTPDPYQDTVDYIGP